MNMMIRPVIPDISNFSFDNWLAIANIFILIAFAGCFALYMGSS